MSTVTGEVRIPAPAAAPTTEQLCDMTVMREDTNTLRRCIRPRGHNADRLSPVWAHTDGIREWE